MRYIAITKHPYSMAHSIPTIITILFLLGYNAKAQNTTDSTTLQKILMLEIGQHGVGVGHQMPLSKKMAIDFSAGLGGGYNISEDGVDYTIDIFRPCMYAVISPKYFYNRKKRIKKGQTLSYNSGNYIGLRLRYTSPSIAESGILDHSLLANLHWGLQRAVGGRWLFNLHLGAGYGQDLESLYGSIYPSIDFKFSYGLRKPRQ